MDPSYPYSNKKREIKIVIPSWEKKSQKETLNNNFLTYVFYK